MFLQKIEASPAACSVRSRSQQKSFLSLSEEKIRRAQKKSRENFFAGWRAVASGGGAVHFRFRFLDLCIRFGKMISKVCKGFNSGAIKLDTNSFFEDESVRSPSPANGGAGLRFATASPSLWRDWTIFVFHKISKRAAYLLLPYILWMSFSAYLKIILFGGLICGEKVELYNKIGHILG